MTRMPEKLSCANVLSVLSCCWTARDLTLIKLATLYTRNAKRGRGAKVNSVNLGLTLIIIEMTKMIVNPVLSAYIMAGPTYILTFPTSSDMRFIKSPVLFCLKNRCVNRWYCSNTTFFKSYSI